MFKLREQITLSKNKAHNIDVLVDHFAVHEFQDEIRMVVVCRLAEALRKSIN